MNEEVMRVDGRQGKARSIRASDERPKPAYLYRLLETPRRNVHKYLIGRDGHIAGGFYRRHRADGRPRPRCDMKELPPLE
jgi:hypothetical protein